MSNNESALELYPSDPEFSQASGRLGGNFEKNKFCGMQGWIATEDGSEACYIAATGAPWIKERIYIWLLAAM